ncbi:potassium channel family protein [Propionivibrio sp.]|uniref:potassium channel family protein n=1 Tax=Propionivibrio sp. TaxID=2212460 RepID=UPI003BF1341F
MILIAGRGQLAPMIEQCLRETGHQVERLPLCCDEDDGLDPALCLRASVLVLAADDDAGNVDLALRARQVKPSIGLVVRLFDSALASYLGETIPGVSILSMSKVTAPVLADAARRLLKHPPERTAGRPGPYARSSRRFRADPILLGALLCLFLLVFPSALFFSQALSLSYIDALYFVWTTVMTVGYGDISLKDAPAGVKLFGMALMLAGASFIAVLFALLSDWVLSRRLDVVYGRTRVRGSGHVIIVGAGNVGFRVAELLAADGNRPVIIERNADSRNVAALRLLGHQAIIADASTRETLELAALERAALIITVTNVDAVNLQIALHARAVNVPVIMRMVSPELSAHINQRGDGIAFSLVVEAAEAFAQEAVCLSGRCT